MSIAAPNYTQIPNVIIDYWMTRLSSIEFNVLLFICRKTFGWHKARDRISLSQIMEAVKSGRSRVSEALQTLVAVGLVKKTTTGTKGQEQTVLELIVSNNSDQCPSGTPPSAETAPTKETPQKKINGNVSENPEPKKYNRPNRWIPDFLKKYPEALPPIEQQKLANQFSEAHLFEALKEAKSFNKSIAKITNLPAYLTSLCKKYKIREKENAKIQRE